MFYLLLLLLQPDLTGFINVLENKLPERISFDEWVSLLIFFENFDFSFCHNFMKVNGKIAEGLTPACSSRALYT